MPGRPLAHWRSTTRDGATGEPRHAESGFLRSVAQGLELVVAHGFGVVEAAVGSFDGDVLALRSSGLLGSPSAKQVDEVERRYEFDGDTLRYTIAMAAVGVPSPTICGPSSDELDPTALVAGQTPAGGDRARRRAGAGYDDGPHGRRSGSGRCGRGPRGALRRGR